MRTRTSLHHFSKRTGSFLLRYLMLFMIVILVSCNFSVQEEDKSDPSLEETQVALSVQQTVLAQQQSTSDANATQNAQQSTSQAQAPQPTNTVQGPPVDLSATQVALSIQQTQMAMNSPVAPPPQQPVVTQAPPQAPANFEEQMKTATILLYEDIVNDPRYMRYVKKTLDAMGLMYKDDGSAKGWLKTDMLGAAPNGKPWDLVILAIETRGQVSGEYFEYLNNILNQGTSVILEAWHLDDISQGAISPILSKCGVMVYPYFTRGDINDAVMWPLGVPSPILTDPNSGFGFTKVLDTWLWSFDLGSKMAMTGKGDAQLLVGTKPTEKFKDGTLAVCMGGQLTLQTFSSHTFSYDTMYGLWENYIYNALKVRLLGGS